MKDSDLNNINTDAGNADIIAAAVADAPDGEYSDTPEKNKIEPSTLYLVATPIGNLADISDRAKKTLSRVDFIAAEDTRVSAKLLAAIGVRKPLFPYHEHNKREAGEQIRARLSAGESCALVTDAGMPVISDPGEDIARMCIESGLRVTCVPGANAALCALVLSGFDAHRFAFEGFISDEGRTSRQRARLEETSGDRRTLIFYEAPHRLRETLSLMLEVFGDRRIALARELTKLNEEIDRTTLSAAVKQYEAREPRGEYVLVVEGKTDSAEGLFWSDMSVADHVGYYTALGMTKNEAIKAVAKDRGVAKNVIYKEFI
ncbi:MAG: 16S rRNA (cytidine(1402)-2'-O)-methyltransferase [Eubacteriales bacterium]